MVGQQEIEQLRGKRIKRATWGAQAYTGCDDRSIFLEFDDGTSFGFEVRTHCDASIAMFADGKDQPLLKKELG